MRAVPSTIAVDMTPVLPGGENGGAKVFVLDLLARLAEASPETRFVLLTQASAHRELALLDRPNVRRVQVLGAASEGGRSLAAVAWHGASRMIPASVTRALARAAYASHREAKRRAAASALDEARASLLFCPFTAPTLRRDGVPTVSVFYDLQHRRFPAFFTPAEAAFRESVLRETLAHADRIVAISRFTAEELAATGLARAGQIETVPLQASPLPAASPGEDLVTTLGLEGGRYFLYPANSWPHKNHLALIRAFALARSRGLDSALRLVLPGAAAGAHQEIERARHALGLHDRVLMPGFVPSEGLASLMRNAMALVFPSLYEGFGLPVIEAMAAGVPVACSGTTALAEVSGDAALHFDPADEAAMAGALLALAGDGALREDLVSRGRERARAYGDPDAVARAYVRIFEAVLA